MSSHSFLERLSGIRIALLVPLLSVLLGCSESEGSSDTSSAPPPSDSQSLAAPDVSASAVNGPLSGRTISAFSSSLHSLDLSTGIWTPLEGQSLSNVRERFPDANIQILPDFSGPNRLIYTAKNCQPLLVCVGLLSGSGNMTGFTTFDEVRDPVFTNAGSGASSGLAKRSRDGRFIAYTQAEQFLYVARLDVERQIETAAVYDTTIVSSVDIGYQVGSPYDWLPDGSLLYSQDTGELSNRIVLARSRPGSTDVASTISLNGYSGSLRAIEVSPDGNYAMLRFIESLVEIPLVLDLRTNEVFEPVSRERTPFLDIGPIAWSPDSRWLMFNLQRATSLDALVPVVPVGTPQETFQTIFAIRVDGRTRALPETLADSNEEVRIVVSRPRNDPNGPLGPQYPTTGSHWID